MQVPRKLGHFVRTLNEAFKEYNVYKQTSPMKK